MHLYYKRVVIMCLADEILVKKALQGDDVGAEAFGVLMEKHQDTVYNLCSRSVGSTTDAQDLSQET